MTSTSSVPPIHRDLLWPELVLHVLAHLEATAALPSTLYSAVYVQAARSQLGPIEARALGMDVGVLSSQLTTHGELSRVQLLTRLHPCLASALHLAAMPLAEFEMGAHCDLLIRDALLNDCPVAAELLRCAALLEASAFLRWPLPDIVELQAGVSQLLPQYWSIAPLLRTLPVHHLRVLGQRGRAWPDQIWIGIPDINEGPSLSSILWQAAHEATVLEVAARARQAPFQLSERAVEQIAVALMARRAKTCTSASGHDKWLSQLSSEVRDWTNPDVLPGEHRHWLDAIAFESL